MNSIGELSVLRGNLVLALDMQRYHELLDVDDRVRAQLESAMEYANSTRCSAIDKQAIKIELSELMLVYQDVVGKCESRSNELKKECLRLGLSKKKTDQYLDVAGRT
jgi:hypothetical protein